MNNPNYLDQPKEHEEYPIGVGYYAMRVNRNKAGKVCTKLVKRDRSKQPNLGQQIAIKEAGGLKPSIGKRPRVKHRARAAK